MDTGIWWAGVGKQIPMDSSICPMVHWDRMDGGIWWNRQGDHPLLFFLFIIILHIIQQGFANSNMLIRACVDPN